MGGSGGGFAGCGSAGGGAAFLAGALLAGAFLADVFFAGAFFAGPDAAFLTAFFAGAFFAAFPGVLFAGGSSGRSCSSAIWLLLRSCSGTHHASGHSRAECYPVTASAAAKVTAAIIMANSAPE